MFQSKTRLLAAVLLLAPLASAVRAQALPRNVNGVGVQVLPLAPQARVVPFQMQNANFPQAAILGPALPVLQQPLLYQRQLAAANRVLVLNAVQRRQLTALLQEQLQLAALQDQLSLWGSQPLNAADQQQLAALQTALAAQQQQNLLQQLAVLQP